MARVQECEIVGGGKCLASSVNLLTLAWSNQQLLMFNVTLRINVVFHCVKSPTISSNECFRFVHVEQYTDGAAIAMPW